MNFEQHNNSGPRPELVILGASSAVKKDFMLSSASTLRTLKEAEQDEIDKIKSHFATPIIYAQNEADASLKDYQNEASKLIDQLNLLIDDQQLSAEDYLYIYSLLNEQADTDEDYRASIEFLNRMVEGHPILYPRSSGGASFGNIECGIIAKKPNIEPAKVKRGFVPRVNIKLYSDASIYTNWEDLFFAAKVGQPEIDNFIDEWVNYYKFSSLHTNDDASLTERALSDLASFQNIEVVNQQLPDITDEVTGKAKTALFQGGHWQYRLVCNLVNLKKISSKQSFSETVELLKPQMERQELILKLGEALTIANCEQPEKDFYLSILYK